MSARAYCIECGSELGPEEIGHVDVCISCCYRHEYEDAYNPEDDDWWDENEVWYPAGEEPYEDSELDPDEIVHDDFGLHPTES